MSKWTNERVEILTKLWCEGKTAKEIAGVLGDGVTRNAVIGKAHRLKLSGRVSPIQQNKSVEQEAVETKAKKTGKVLEATRTTQTVLQRKKATAQAAEKPKTQKIARSDISALADKGLGKPVSMIDLKDTMCKWPIGDPQEEGFHFCGARKNNSGTYCEQHAQIAYNVNVRSKTIAEIDDSAGASQRDATDEMLASVANA